MPIYSNQLILSVILHYCFPFFFNQFRKDTYGRFTRVYGDDEDRSRAVKDTTITPEETLQNVIDFYYSSLLFASGEDLLKIEPVGKLGVYSVLQFISYKIDKEVRRKREQDKSVG